LGYWVGGDADTPFGARASAFGHPGAGGSIAFADPEYRFSFALLKNALSYRGTVWLLAVGWSPLPNVAALLASHVRGAVW
jgi:CubicO group peptidase (beta-lactamase class C family)